MPETGNIEKSHVSVKTFVISLVLVASGAITGTVAWMTVVHANTRVEYINDRLDKKTGRNEEAIKNLEDRVNALELPNTDK